jgi:hypothetical protein
MNRHNPRVRVAFRTMPKFPAIAKVYSRFVPLGSRSRLALRLGEPSLRKTGAGALASPFISRASST